MQNSLKLYYFIIFFFAIISILKATPRIPNIRNEIKLFALDKSRKPFLNKSYEKKNIAINSNTSIYITKQPKDTFICSGQDAVFSVEALNADTYQWEYLQGNYWYNLSSGSTYNGTTTPILLIKSVNSSLFSYRYRCILRKGFEKISSSEVKLTVSTNTSNPKITIQTPFSSICSNTQVNFTSIVSKGGIAPTFKWYVNNFYTGIATQNFASNNLKDGDEITCRLLSNDGCGLTDSALSNKIKIRIGAPPIVSITGDSCVLGSIKLLYNSKIDTIKWQLNGSTIATNSSFHSPNGLTVAGGNGDGGNNNQLSYPRRIFVDDSLNIFISDLQNNRVQKWREGQSVGITYVSSASPSSVYLLARTGSLYICEPFNGVIKIKPLTSNLATIISGLDLPTDIFVDDNLTVYVSEQAGSIVSKWSGDYKSKEIVVGTGPGSRLNQLEAPTGIFVDNYENIFVCDPDNNRVVKWVPNATTGILVAGTGSKGFNMNELANPLDVLVDKKGALYIADYNNHRIQKWLQNANEGITIAGGNGTGNSVNQLNNPVGVCLDAEENLYVSDRGNHRVQKFNKTIIDTLLISATGNYTATVTWPNGCISTTDTFKVYPIQSPAVSIKTDAKFICPNEPVSFNSLNTLGGTSPQYEWRINKKTIGSLFSGSFTSVLNPKDTVDCIMTSNAAGCIVPKTVISNSIILDKNPAPKPELSILGDSTICENTPVTFIQNTFNNGIGSKYDWYLNNTMVNTGNTYRSLTLNDNDSVFCIVTTNNGCPVSDTSNIIKMFVDKMPIVSFSPDTVVFNGTFIQLSPLVSGANIFSYKWTPSLGLNSDTIKNPISHPTNNITHTLYATTKNGCIASGDITIKIDRLFIPNAFSPNGDNINDVWKIIGLPQNKKYVITVFDRYGRPVFSSIDYSTQWNGTFNGSPLPVGTYYYTIHIKDTNAKYSGSLTLLR